MDATVSSLVALDVLALRDVPFSSGLIEPPLAVGALHVVRRVRGWWGRQIADLPAGGQVTLGLLGRTQGRDHFLALATPVGLFSRLHIRKK